MVQTLILLRDRGDIDDDYRIDCLLAETPAQQAAAIVLPNTEHAPVHIADVITAIGKLRKAKMDTQAISTALGYAELEIKRLEALAAVHPTVLKALRQGRLTLKQVRLFARLPDKKQQAEIAQTALDGYFQDYQLRAVVEHDRATVEDDRFTLVGMDRYLAAGGRVASDLFGEYPDFLLDPEVLQGALRERVQPIVDHLKAEGLAVFVAREVGYSAPDGFFRLAHVWERDLDEAQKTALADARYAVTQLESFLAYAIAMSTTFYEPYMPARKLGTLDHITKGKIGWNIVCSISSGEAKNFGMDELPPHDERDDFMGVCYKLWTSWESAALLMDMDYKISARRAKIQKINHVGRWFKCQGPLTVPPSPQKHPHLFQAGAYERGRQFAAQHAECVFAVGSGVKQMRVFEKDMKTRFDRAGRNPDLRIIWSAQPIVAESESEARPAEGNPGPNSPRSLALAHVRPLQHRPDPLPKRHTCQPDQKPRGQRNAGYDRGLHAGKTRHQPCGNRGDLPLRLR